MALSNYLEPAVLYTNYGITPSDISETFVERIITKTNSLLDKKFSRLFALTTNQVEKYRNKPSGRLISIDFWQKTGLVVKRGCDGDDTLETLTEGVDYRLVQYSDIGPSGEYPNAVCAVRLYGSNLASDKSYLQIEGTRGLTDEVPDELFLDDYLYDIILKAAYINKSMVETEGAGAVISSKIDKVEMKFADSNESTPSELQTVAGTLQYINTQLNFIAANFTPEILSAELIG